jgi:hypothetical protein
MNLAIPDEKPVELTSATKAMQPKKIPTMVFPIGVLTLTVTIIVLVYHEN